MFYLSVVCFYFIEITVPRLLITRVASRLMVVQGKRFGYRELLDKALHVV